MGVTYKADSNFVWTDLSSYDTKASRRFYEVVFGWKSYDMGKMASDPDDQFGMDQVSYHVAMQKDQPAAGIFDMPPFFQTIKMPPFWMSYLAVDDLEAVVARAKSIEGAIVDVEPTPFGDGMMALTRDPLGAGFTCYEGPSIDAKNDGSDYGRMVWNELITESIDKVAPFYQEVLGFDLVPDADFGGGRVKVMNGKGEEIAGIQEVEASLRSEKVYWLPFFSIDNLDDFAKRVKDAGGTEISRTSYGGGFDSGVFYDDTGAAFAVQVTGAEQGDVRPWYRKLF
jgi:predicted enzyme related to lactoylglutathione lyase